MSESEISLELEIRNKKGLHARAAAAFVKTVDAFDAVVEVERLGQKVGGCSIMGLMMLAASNGTTIKIFATGAEASAVVEALRNLLENKFGEE